MDKFETGMLARAKAGHDTGRVYVITGVDEAYVYLSDGKLRPSDPRKKRKSTSRSFWKNMIWKAPMTARSGRY